MKASGGSVIHCCLSRTNPTGYWPELWRYYTKKMKVEFLSFSCWKQHCLALGTKYAGSLSWPISRAFLQCLGTPRISSTIQAGTQTGTCVGLSLLLSLGMFSHTPTLCPNPPTHLEGGSQDPRSSGTMLMGWPQTQWPGFIPRGWTAKQIAPAGQ